MENCQKKHAKKISDAFKGRALPEETRIKISESHKGKILSDETKRKVKKAQTTRKIAQYNLQGEFIKSWDCISDAGRSLKIDISSISKCCRGFYSKVGGFIWKYFEDKLTEEDIISRNKSERERRVAQYSLSGGLICIFNSIKEAELKTNVYYSGISRCCMGIRKSAGGFIWRYYEDDNMECAV